MKAHLSRSHNVAGRSDREVEADAYISCCMCNFKQPFSEVTLFSNLRSHLRKHEMVACAFKNCNYRTNVYSSFNTQKIRKHVGSSDFYDNVVSAENDSTPLTYCADCVVEGLL